MLTASMESRLPMKASSIQINAVQSCRLNEKRLPIPGNLVILLILLVQPEMSLRT